MLVFIVLFLHYVLKIIMNLSQRGEASELQHVLLTMQLLGIFSFPTLYRDNQKCVLAFAHRRQSVTLDII
jgi:hypothetical protein